MDVGQRATSLRLPVGSRVASATAAVVPITAIRTTISPTPVYDGTARVVRFAARFMRSTRRTPAGSGGRFSYDDALRGR